MNFLKVLLTKIRCFFPGKIFETNFITLWEYWEEEISKH